jgi:hypothetical protein
MLTILGLLLVACSDKGVDLTTSSSVLNGPSQSGGPTTTAISPETTTTTVALVGTTVASYEVVARDTTGPGEVLYIVIPQAAYTDVDLENFVGDLLDSGAVRWGAEVFDDIQALEAYQKSEATRTADEQDLIDKHHFVSLFNGDTMRFQGPYSTSGEFVIGS